METEPRTTTTATGTEFVATFASTQDHMKQTTSMNAVLNRLRIAQLFSRYFRQSHPLVASVTAAPLVASVRKPHSGESQSNMTVKFAVLGHLHTANLALIFLLDTPE